MALLLCLERCSILESGNLALEFFQVLATNNRIMRCLLYLLLAASASNASFSLLYRPSKESFSGVYYSRTQWRRIRKNPSCRQKSTQLKIQSPFDDDLPNILGINPIEAAILFGVLYYIYGPNVLYEYAREAGKLFSTYAPIIKDVTLDIFNEFKDFLEEDRERNLLMKNGVDISSIPRRTTNLIERFQEAMKAFDTTTSNKNDVSVLQNAYKSRINDITDVDSSLPSSTQPSSSSPSRINRKSKRDVLVSRNVDVDEVINATKNMATPDESAIVESFTGVQQRMSELQQLEPPQTDSKFDLDQSESFAQSTEAPRWITNPFDEMDSNTFPTPPSVDPAGLSKFQQQMSGAWNQRIMEGNDDTPSWNGQLVESSASLIDYEELNAMPMDIAATDGLTAEEFLQQIDTDYQQLRAKVVAFVNQQNAVAKVEQTPSLESFPSPRQEAISKIDDFSGTEIGMKKSYWPIKSSKKKRERNEDSNSLLD